MDERKLRFAIIGLDHWYTAIDLAKTLMGDSRVDLVGIADASIERAREIAGIIGLAEFTDDLHKYIEDDSIDVIGSFVTVDHNPGIVIAAAEAGKHILSIKPFAKTLAEGTDIVAAVRKAGVQFIPAESLSRQTEIHQYLKRVVEEGTIGEIVSGNFTLISSLPQNWPGAPNDGGWWADPAKVPGGGWIDHSIYQIDRLRWLLGEEAVRVTGRAANLVHKDLGVEDYGHAIVEFAHGATFSIEDTWSGPAGSWRITSVLVGTSGVVSLDTLAPHISLFGVGSEGGWSTQPLLPDDMGKIDALLDQLTGSASTSLGTVEDAWANLAVSLAFYESARSGSPAAGQQLG